MGIEDTQSYFSPSSDNKYDTFKGRLTEDTECCKNRAPKVLIFCILPKSIIISIFLFSKPTHSLSSVDSTPNLPLIRLPLLYVS